MGKSFTDFLFGLMLGLLILILWVYGTEANIKKQTNFILGKSTYKCLKTNELKAGK